MRYTCRQLYTFDSTQSYGNFRVVSRIVVSAITNKYRYERENSNVINQLRCLLKQLIESLIREWTMQRTDELLWAAVWLITTHSECWLRNLTITTSISGITSRWACPLACPLSTRCGVRVWRLTDVIAEHYPRIHAHLDIHHTLKNNKQTTNPSAHQSCFVDLLVT